MWEHPCIACVGLIFFFGVRAAFGLDACPLSSVCAGCYPLNRGYADAQPMHTPGKTGAVLGAQSQDSWQWWWSVPTSGV